jgi:hypothetical protein
MEQQQSVWKQIEEEKNDYQYFKKKDQEKLQLTLQAIKKESIDENKEV